MSVRTIFLLVLALCAFGLPAQGETAAPATDFSKVFGQPGSGGFTVGFSVYGASVKSVHLNDHLAEATVAAEEASTESYLLSDILWSNPSLRESYYTWLGVEEWSAGNRQLPDLDLRTAAWRLATDEENRVVFALDCGNGLTIEKHFSYETGRRDLAIDIVLRASEQHPSSGQELKLRMTGLAVRSPQAEYTLGQNVARCVGETRSIEGDSTVDEFAAQAASGPIEGQPLPVAANNGVSRIRFAGSTNRFFGAFLYPADDSGSDGLFSAAMRPFPSIGQSDIPANTLPVCEYGLRLTIPAAGRESRIAYRMYLGPKSRRVFAENAEYERFGSVVDYDLNPACFCDIPGTRTIARFLLWMLGTLFDFVGNWGFAIMLLTIIVRGALVPLNFRMQKSMRVYGSKMTKLKPRLDAIQKQYANDRKALQAAMMEFQREHKLFPPIGGCLPMFVTIPVFIGLFTALRTSYDLRQQQFFGWLTDLSQPDALFELGLGFAPTFNLLPIIMVGLWWWLQSSTPLPSDPQQRQMMKIMRFMPLIFGVMLYNYASGLMVYMITSSMFALVEQRIVKRILGPVNPDAAAFGAPQI